MDQRYRRLASGGTLLISLISLLVVIFLSILITRVATIALTHTGLTRESAKFQARSALSGAGFTTSESEMVVNHPVRRKIVMFLILIGNAGIVAAMSSLILTFVSEGDQTSLSIKIVLLVCGIVAIWGFASSQWVDRRLSRLIDVMLKRYTKLNITDYASLLHLTGEYRLAELKIKTNDWLDGLELKQARLRDEGINVLGVRRQDGTYIGNPVGETSLQRGDSLVLYGRISAIDELDKRKSGSHGNREHREAVEEQQDVLKKEVGKDSKTPSPDEAEK
ncbi:MAG: TrkA C-terminal domain-containing protein [Desulfohalobiaceae bacterium]|nr:TrkA C-terminal domain-containing protein [Desulfohalobiaceae bacterium]